MNKEEIENLVNTDFDKFTLVLNRIYKEEYVIQLEKQNKKYKEVIDKAIDKLYCWGEVLDADFQKIMLDILKEVE